MSVTQEDILVAKQYVKELKSKSTCNELETIEQALDMQIAVSRIIIEGQYFCPKCKNLMKYPGYCGCGQKVY